MIVGPKLDTRQYMDPERRVSPPRVIGLELRRELTRTRRDVTTIRQHADWTTAAGYCLRDYMYGQDTYIDQEHHWLPQEYLQGQYSPVPNRASKGRTHRGSHGCGRAHVVPCGRVAGASSVANMQFFVARQHGGVVAIHVITIPKGRGSAR